MSGVVCDDQNDIQNVDAVSAAIRGVEGGEAFHVLSIPNLASLPFYLINKVS